MSSIQLYTGFYKEMPSFDIEYPSTGALGEAVRSITGSGSTQTRVSHNLMKTVWHNLMSLWHPKSIHIQNPGTVVVKEQCHCCIGTKMA